MCNRLLLVRAASPIDFPAVADHPDLLASGVVCEADPAILEGAGEQLPAPEHMVHGLGHGGMMRRLLANPLVGPRSYIDDSPDVAGVRPDGTVTFSATRPFGRRIKCLTGPSLFSVFFPAPVLVRTITRSRGPGGTTQRVPYILAGLRSGGPVWLHLSRPGRDALDYGCA